MELKGNKIIFDEQDRQLVADLPESIPVGSISQGLEVLGLVQEERRVLSYELGSLQSQDVHDLAYYQQLAGIDKLYGRIFKLRKLASSIGDIVTPYCVNELLEGVPGVNPPLDGK